MKVFKTLESKYPISAVKGKSKPEKKRGRKDFIRIHTQVPIRLLHKVHKEKHYTAGLKAFLMVKLTTSRVQITKAEMPGWKSALGLGLVKEDPNNNRKLYLIGYRRYYGPKVAFTQGDVLKNLNAKVTATLMQYRLVIHEGTGDNAPDAGKCRRRNGDSVLNPSVHNGGVSLSLMSKLAGKSKSSWSRARKQINESGIGVINRRTIQISEAAGDERQRLRPDDYGGKGYLFVDCEGRLWKEITSECLLAIHIDYRRCYTPPSRATVAKAARSAKKAWSGSRDSFKAWILADTSKMGRLSWYNH